SPSLSLPIPHPPSSTLFPYTTLFRSRAELDRRPVGVRLLQLRCTEQAVLVELRLDEPEREPCPPDLADLDFAHQERQRADMVFRSEEHTSELQSRGHLVCRLLLEKKK